MDSATLAPIGISLACAAAATQFSGIMKRNNQCSLPLVRDPFGNLFSRLLDDFDNSTSEASANRLTSPRTNIAENDDGYELAFELPGIAEADIDVQLQDKVLTVSAERKDVRDESDNKRWHRMEQRYGRYSRSIRLPNDAADKDIEAVYAAGILTVSVPKRADAQPAKITVRKAEG